MPFRCRQGQIKQDLSIFKWNSLQIILLRECKCLSRFAAAVVVEAITYNTKSSGHSSPTYPMSTSVFSALSFRSKSTTFTSLAPFSICRTTSVMVWPESRCLRAQTVWPLIFSLNQSLFQFAAWVVPSDDASFRNDILRLVSSSTLKRSAGKI